MRRELAAAAAPLSGWHEALDAEARRVSAALDQVAREGEIWSATLERPETTDADETVARRVGATLQLLGETTGALRAWRNRVLALDDRVLERRTAVTNKLARVQESAKAQRTSLLVPDRRAALAIRLLRARCATSCRGCSGAFARFAEQNFEYLLSDPRPLIAQALLAAMLAVALHRAAAAARRRAARLAGARRCDARARAPDRGRDALGAARSHRGSSRWRRGASSRWWRSIALIAVARVVCARLAGVEPPRARGSVRAAAARPLRARVRRASRRRADDLPARARARDSRSRSVSCAAAGYWATGAAGCDAERTVALGALAIALAAEMGGWSRLAALLGRGAHRRGADGSLRLGGRLRAGGAARLDAALAALEPTAARRSPRPPAGPLGRAWASGSISLVVTHRPARRWSAQALRRILDAGISVGALSVTLGGVLAFALTIAAAPFIARCDQRRARGGRLPARALSRGVPYALSTMVRYAVFTLAFIAALAAAGVQLEPALDPARRSRRRRGPRPPGLREELRRRAHAAVRAARARG